MNKYMLKPLYLPAKDDNDKQIVACIGWKLHIVDNLRINLLIGNNIIGAKEIKIDITNEKAFVPGCKATFLITTQQRSQFIRQELLSAIYVTISLQSQVFVPITSLLLPQDQDFFFEPHKQPRFALFANLMNHEMAGIIVQIEIALSIQVLWCTKLEMISKMPFDNCFTAEIKADSVMTLPQQHPELLWRSYLNICSYLKY